MFTDPLPAATHGATPTETAPSWSRIARALLVGFALGLVVHVLLSLLLVQLGAESTGAGGTGSAVQCREQAPARQPASARPPLPVLAS
ncbi:MAG TPA: hypothetical protein VD833_16065 [Vicinamibacterales bacterium]|nr:hypothetical protein [Vicinamibacterales bacterium]